MIGEIRRLHLQPGPATCNGPKVPLWKVAVTLTAGKSRYLACAVSGLHFSDYRVNKELRIASELFLTRELFRSMTVVPVVDDMPR